MRYALVVILLSLFCFNTSTAFSGTPNWDPPKLNTGPLSAPKLQAILSLDSDLSEWKGVPCVCARQISASGKDIDAAFEFYVAWTDDGLCLAVNIADDELSPLDGQDIITLLVDSRAPEKRVDGDYNEVEYQISLHPPIGNRKSAIIAGPDVPRMAEMKTAGKVGNNGYVMEALIPWGVISTLPVKVGGECRIQCLYFDYDPHDPATSAFYLTRGPWWPRAYTDYKLVDKLTSGKDVSLKPAVDISAPVIMYPYTSTPISVNLCPGISENVESINIMVKDRNGKEITSGSSKPEQRPGLPSGWTAAVLNWIPRVSDDGYLIADARLMGRDGQPLGYSQERISVITVSMSRALSALKNANLPFLSQTEPFHAAAYLGVAACQERLKQAAQEGRLPDVKLAYNELNAKLDILEGKMDLGEDRGIFNLLRLSSIPESEVTLEFPEANKATIAFNLGAIPIINAEVTQYPTARDAADSLITKTKSLYHDKYKHIRIGRYKAVEASVRATKARITADEFKADREVLLVSNKNGSVEVLPVGLISGIKVDAVTILNDCPKTIKDTITSWAILSKTPVSDFKTASAKESFLIAGNINDPLVGAIIANLPFYAVVPDASGVEVCAMTGNRVVRVQSRSHRAAELTARLILDCEPVQISDVETIRKALVQSRPPKVTSSEADSNLNFYTGDVHSHTIFSDGSATPTGLSLEAMYCYLDYLVITDHNAIQGARFAQKLVSNNGLSYPIIVGEEVEVSTYAEFNVYPLNRLIPAGLNPDECIKIAHESGSVAHWNHPGYPDWRNIWPQTHLKSGINDTGLDAWEHYPYHYQDWKNAGTLPVIMGSSDTHDARFNNKERTLIYAPSPSAESLADAVRKQHILMLSPSGKDLFYGSDWLISLAWDALEDGNKLKSEKAERLKTVFRSANVPALIRASSPTIEQADE